MLTDNLRNSFEAVIREYETDRASVHAELAGLQRRLRELDQTIASLYRKIGVQPPAPVVEIRNQTPIPPKQKYASISVHWAILHLLSEAVNPMTTAEIADALTAAGVKTKAANFTNNVSAVLTTNMRPKGEEEVETVNGGWRLTETGRNKITHIVASPKFRAGCPWIVGVVPGAI